MKILRIRFFFDHSSPFKRIISEEITIYNDSTENVDKLIIPLSEFRMGLKIYDADNYELPYLPKEFIDRKLRDIIDDPEKIESISPFFKDKAILWISLPNDRKIKPNESRILKLVYHDSKNIPSKILSIFNIPFYREFKDVNKAEDYDTFYIIQSSLGYNIKYKLIEGIAIPDIYQNVTDNFISIRIPHTGNFRFSFNYNILLNRADMWFWRLLTYSLYFLSFFLLDSVRPFLFICSLSIDLCKILAPIVITLCITLFSLIKDPITIRFIH